MYIALYAMTQYIMKSLSLYISDCSLRSKTAGYSAFLKYNLKSLKQDISTTTFNSYGIEFLCLFERFLQSWHLELSIWHICLLLQSNTFFNDFFFSLPKPCGFFLNDNSGYLYRYLHFLITWGKSLFPLKIFLPVRNCPLKKKNYDWVFQLLRLEKYIKRCSVF